MVDDVACEPFISSSSISSPYLPVTHLSEFINSTQPYSHSSSQEENFKKERMEGRKLVNPNKWFSAKLYNLPQILLWMCIVRLLCGNIADISLEGFGYCIKQKQCSPNISKNGTLITARGQNWIFLKCDIQNDYVSVTGKRRKGGGGAFINHFLTSLRHYPKLTFSQPLCVSHQKSIIPVKAVWIVG